MPRRPRQPPSAALKAISVTAETDPQRDLPSLRRQVWLILDPPDGEASPVAQLVNIALILLISANVLAVLLESVSSLHSKYKTQFDTFEVLSVAIFTVEYLLRLWVAPEGRPALRTGQARLRWARSPMAIIDLLAILPSLLAMIVPFDLRLLRVLRVLRVFKLTRYSSAMTILQEVFREEAGSFFAGFFILFILLILVSTGAYMVEHQAQPDAFGSIPAAMWWAIVTLTTVGYGDVSPITPMGKVFGGLVTVIGIGVAALPAGILASGLNDHLHRRRDSLRLQFRLALEDGQIDPREAAEIEALRRKMGISREVAAAIQAEVLLRQREIEDCTCPHCGKEFSRPTPPDDR